MAKAAALAAQHGFKWFDGDWPSFDPREGHAADCCEDLCHELAHFLVSPKRLRDLPYFGLGHPASPMAPHGISSQRASQLEEEASVLGIALQFECEGDYKAASDVARHHDWSEYDAVVVGRLERKGQWSPQRDQVWREVLRLRKGGKS